jgi:multiple sugar transport system substrate-binding protein
MRLRTRFRWAIALAVLAIVATACSSAGGAQGGGSGGSNGAVTIDLWHGYQGKEGKEMNRLVAEYERLHPNVHIQQTFISNLDYALQKVETAIAGGQPPDIAYLYGSWAANIAQSPRTVTLNSLIKSDPSFNWNDFWPGERDVATVGSKIVGIPALVDNLALVYNKTLFRKAHVPFPTDKWTWKTFTNAAIKLTSAQKKQFGWAYVADGSEDTVWRFEAMLWQAGGSILTPNDKKAAFDSPAGVAALSMLGNMARHHAMYLDNGNGDYWNLFNSGHIAMLWTGPWDLPFTKVNYGVQILPADLNHQTISGPDNWILFNNGPTRLKAAWNFMKWFTSTRQDADWIVHTCDLPIRRSVMKTPQFHQFLQKCPGDGTFVHNLSNVKHARPVLTTYPKISEAIGQAVVSVILQKATPRQALAQAATKVNQILAIPTS